MVSFPRERFDLSRKPYNALLDEISTRVSSQQYETWFRNLPIHFSSPDKIMITTSNRFSKIWIENKFREVISSSAEKVFGIVPRIEILLHTQEAPPDSEAPAASRVTGPPAVETEPHGPAAPPPSSPPPALHSPQSTQSVVAGGDHLTSISLNREYTFANFVIGPSNRLAHAAALGVTEALGRGYNPLFIYGGVGLGKTHLLHAIVHRLNESPGLRVVYLTSEAFTNQLKTAGEKGAADDFRRRLRSADVLIVDDIQFIAKKDRAQEEFFHTFNALISEAKQVVLSSDCPPKEISGLEDRLISRFKMGLVTRIETPGFETRVAILHKKARARGKEIPESVAEYISNHIVNNIRELEGAISRLFSLASIQKGPEDHGSAITLELARAALTQIVQEDNFKSGVTIPEIQKAVALYYDVKLAEILSKHRNRTVSFARQVSMYLSRKLTHCSLQELGTLTGGRNHATVIFSVRKITGLCKTDPRIKADIDILSGRILASRSAL
jgi:chromosomal replication initiator protein